MLHLNHISIFVKFDLLTLYRYFLITPSYLADLIIGKHSRHLRAAFICKGNITQNVLAVSLCSFLKQLLLDAFIRTILAGVYEEA